MFGVPLKIIQYIILAPSVIQLVNTLVQTFESAGNGEEKKKAVLDSVKMVYDTTNSFFPIKVPYAFVESLAGASVDIIVDFYNLIGHFKHKKKEDQPEQEKDK